jgi:outer membrane immunogenic protein
MKRLLVVGTSLAALIAGPAMAADQAPRGYRAPAMYAPIASWTGFYVGGDIGVAWANSQTYTFADPGNAAFFSCANCTLPYLPEALTSGRKNGFLGGLHVGYDWQFAPRGVIGAEWDFMWTSKLQQSATAPLFSDALATSTAVVPVFGSALSFDNQTKWLTSIRGKAGYLVTPNLLVYGTGGVAWTRYTQSAVASCLPPATANGCVFTSGGIASFANDQTRTGFVAGAGAEWQIAATQWRARLEYLYYGFNSGTTGSGLWLAVPGGGPLPCFVTPTCSAVYSFSNQNIQTVRVGISYAFGGYAVAAPAVYK